MFANRKKYLKEKLSKIGLTFGDEVREFFDFLFPMLLLLLTIFVRFFHVGSHNIILFHDGEKSETNKKIRFYGTEHSNTNCSFSISKLRTDFFQLPLIQIRQLKATLITETIVIRQFVVSAKSVKL